MVFPGLTDLQMNAEPQKNNNRRTTKTQPRTSQKKQEKPKPAKEKKSTKTETSADIKRKQAATQIEIQQTEAKVEENEKFVRQGIDELGRIEGDIVVSKNRILQIDNQLKSLSTKISSLENNITSDEAELKKLREEYLKAVKKMRLTRKTVSPLAFIFSSENFNQAVRRMRYLKEFSDWRERQSAAITKKIESLKQQKEELARARSQQDIALKQQKEENARLETQYSRQNTVVTGLKKEGEALKAYLAKKQKEANDLKYRISEVIAQEERRAAEERERRREAEERRRQEAAERAREAEERRRREQEQLALEKQQREAEQARKAAEEELRKAEEARKAADSEKKKAEAEKKKAEAERKRAEAERKQAEAEKKKTEAKNQENQSYAEARRRKPRGTTTDGSSSSSSSGSSSSSDMASSAAAPDNSFAGMKGRLPLPASGSFKVTSRFGRQSLPDLPDIVYDNPGIDARVNAGAAAVAVYGGKVSGVYMLPGYNTVIIVSHGNYYTVYGNISAAAVKVGDTVKAGQTLGKVANDEDDSRHGLIHFEVWRNREKLNPLEWIRASS